MIKSPKFFERFLIMADLFSFNIRYILKNILRNIDPLNLIFSKWLESKELSTRKWNNFLNRYFKNYVNSVKFNITKSISVEFIPYKIF